MSAADFSAWSAKQLVHVERALSAWVPADAPAGLGDAIYRLPLCDMGTENREKLRATLRKAGVLP